MGPLPWTWEALLHKLFGWWRSSDSAVVGFAGLRIRIGEGGVEMRSPSEGDRAVFVGNGRRVAVTRRGVGDETAESALAAHRHKCAQRLVRANWVDHAAAGRHSGGGQPVAHLVQTGQVHDAVSASATALRRNNPAVSRLVRPWSRGQSQ